MPNQSVITPPDTRKGYEWTARIRCIMSELGLGTNFLVHIFLGPIPEPPANLTGSPNRVGTFYTYSDCSDGDEPVQGFVHLGHYLLEHRGVQNLKPENVVPYLKSNLKWCVEKGRGERVDLHDLPSLEVMVLEVPLTWSPGERIPEVGLPKEHPDITHGTEGGAK